jgi:ribosomal protein L15
MDDRMPLAQRLPKVGFNTFTGLSLEDNDVERTREKAARQMLNKLLESSPGVRTYENITVPEDVLRSMPKEQRDMYLLYKIIQTEAAKRARDKKKAQAGMDPMQMLGVTQQF